MSQDILLNCKQISKSFAGVRVLDAVDFDVRKGEIHALVGQNGAGKSTLIKIISGVYSKDSGEILVNGKTVEIKSPLDSLKNGIAVVYQELSIIPGLTVAENIMVGREKSRFGFLKKKERDLEVQRMLDEYGIALDAHEMGENLSLAQCKMVEIAKAVSFDASIIILDEPTAALSSKESQILFDNIYRLRDKGISILYISHRLDEVYMLSDRITVLRDGHIAKVFEKEEIDPVQIVRQMIGKHLDMNRKDELRSPSKNQQPVLEIKNLTKKGIFKDVSLTVHEGEILAIGGLVGSGRTDLLRCVFGDQPYSSGEVLFLGKPAGKKPGENIRKGMGFITEDRLHEGFVPLMSVQGNIGIVDPDRMRVGKIFASKKLENEMGVNIIKRMQIHPENPYQNVVNLSGGNQQKVVVGKWLRSGIRLLLIDEPTIGVDIGAKAEIYDIIEELAKDGMAVLLVSSDNEELCRIATRILIMRNGEIVKEFNNGYPSQEDILVVSSGAAKQ